MNAASIPPDDADAFEGVRNTLPGVGSRPALVPPAPTSGDESGLRRIPSDVIDPWQIFVKDGAMRA